MKIEKSLETPEGTVTFSGTLNPEEVDFILTVGLNYLMQQGAIPFRVAKASEGINVAPGSVEPQ